MILFASDRREDAVLRPADSEIYSVEVASGALAALTHRTGPDFNVQVSPDGSKIAYLGHDDTGHNYDNNQLYVMSRDGSASRSLTAALDRSIDAVHWESSGALWASYLDHGVQRVIRITLSGQVKTVASGLVGAGLELPMMSGATFSVSRRGLIAYAGGDSLHPPDIYIAGYRSGFRRLTRLNDALLAGKTLAPVRHAPVTASDGRTIDTWLATPPGYVTNTKVPLILEIHGGPYAAYGPAFSTAQQLYAAAGYAVLYANPRGSISYGAEFANLIEETFPDGVHGDLMAAVDAAIAQGIADPDDLFVTGASAGGSLTAWIIGKTHRFKAAATQMPVINWLSWRLTTDRPAQYFPGWLASKPWEDPQGYWARSPLSLVGNVTTPTLVICGTEDFITRISESEQYYTALKLQRVPTAFIRVPGVGHGDIAARPTQSAAKAAAITAWFDRYRRPIQ
jgi:dipeptidyl aminopeptidase/acylaminoacyl peptidase